MKKINDKNKKIISKIIKQDKEKRNNKIKIRKKSTKNNKKFLKKCKIIEKQFQNFFS